MNQIAKLLTVQYSIENIRVRCGNTMRICFLVRYNHFILVIISQSHTTANTLRALRPFLRAEKKVSGKAKVQSRR